MWNEIIQSIVKIKWPRKFTILNGDLKILNARLKKETYSIG